MIQRRDLPIAETFHSIQGEGQWVGTPMHFIRLAGCNVGRPAKVIYKQEADLFPMLPSGRQASVCHSWDGRAFACDTDYSLHDRLSFTFLRNDTYERHICLTGGEPLMHDNISDFITFVSDRGIMVHVETSGTVDFDKNASPCWLTVAPKIGAQERMLTQADEIKLLVDEHFNLDHLTPAMKTHRNVFLCPINDISDVKLDNVERCMELLKSHPTWRLSFQAHKFLRLR